MQWPRQAPITALFVGAFIFLLFTGCDGTNSDSSPSSTPTTDTQTSSGDIPDTQAFVTYPGSAVMLRDGRKSHPFRVAVPGFQE